MSEFIFTTETVVEPNGEGGEFFAFSVTPDFEVAKRMWDTEKECFHGEETYGQYPDKESSVRAAEAWASHYRPVGA